MYMLTRYFILQVWVVSSAEPQLPLLIEDASRPETDSVSVYEQYLLECFWYIVLFMMEVISIAGE